MSLWLRFLNWFASFLPVRNIGDGETLYLQRFRLFGYMPGSSWLGPSLYLHRFHRHDLEEPGVLHTHPWRWSLSLVLAGGYDEERLYLGELPRLAFMLAHRGEYSYYRRRLLAFRFNWLGRDAAHRITKLNGRECWTLFLAGPKASSWGFLVPGRGLVPWRQRLVEKGIEPV